MSPSSVMESDCTDSTLRVSRTLLCTSNGVVKLVQGVRLSSKMRYTMSTPSSITMRFPSFSAPAMSVYSSPSVVVIWITLVGLSSPYSRRASWSGCSASTPPAVKHDSRSVKDLTVSVSASICFGSVIRYRVPSPCWSVMGSASAVPLSTSLRNGAEASVLRLLKSSTWRDRNPVLSWR